MKATPLHWFTIQLSEDDIRYKTVHKNKFFSGCKEYQEVDKPNTRKNIISYLLHKGLLPPLKLGEGYKVVMEDSSFGKISAGVPFSVAISLDVRTVK
jgi:hypothetical protein